ncbi:unnamed protein product [Caenorhabditis angaria]|uniref:Thiamin pyrophosphokinase thiamin-binding domain-containing protein n=1 Tax=Caenorhabditis angaria TaxID=860376 RepID=A0A9P1IJW1_9PELO|nr:unnamed protein product [Caenorhabditis angaria]
MRLVKPFEILKNANIVAIWLNGEISAERDFWLKIWNDAKYRLACDGAANRIGKRNDVLKKPDYLCGDFDSVTKAEKEKYFRLVHLPDQDKTDLQKTIEFSNENKKDWNFDEIILLGGLNGRFDHTMSTLSTLVKFKNQNIIAIDGDNLVFCIAEGESEIEIEVGKTTRICGIMPILQRETIVTTNGLRWNLDKTPLEFGTLISSSNELTSNKMILRIFRRSFSQKIQQHQLQHEYDLIVIGGGSGGLSCSKAASDLGARVALIDAVQPTPDGKSWGIGGTCANVGCIPKKLMHHAAIVGRELKHAEKYGWKSSGNSQHNWSTLVEVVNDRIKANNWVYRVQLNEKGIKYYNAFGTIIDRNTVSTQGVDKKKTSNILKAKNIVISTGLRPIYPKIEGAELGITSDDLFSLEKSPGKTLVVGGGYVALECAGLLADLGHDVDLLIRSEPLKNFDKDCVDKVVSNLESHGVNIKWRDEVVKVEKSGENLEKKRVHFKNSDDPIQYDTVIWAMGRKPNISKIGLENVKVSQSAKNGRILADEFDRTSQDGIYAIGDIVFNRNELTPLAIQSGKLLAKRLFDGSKEIVEYEKVATTVFTPLELSTIGLTEHDALRLYGEHDIEIYHSYFTPFEHVISQDSDSKYCYVKLICMRNEPQNILGLHFVGPNAAEIMQGFAVAFRRGITFSDIKSTIAIHPCSAEEFLKLQITKRSGLDPRVAGCCG